MSMKFTQMITHFSADEALEIIAFLDQLRNVLWINYREEIEVMRRENRHHHSEEKKINSDPDDPIPF